MYDLIIRGGEVIDGTGAARFRADVAVRNGRIVAIGRDLGEAATEIDATGRVVAPGFIDVHTHYDAQVFWDGALTPSPLHGVTTAFAGNCGFSIAPLSGDPDDAEYLMRMLSRVEGMPLESLRAGVPWSWSTTSSYFDAIEGQIGINLGFMVGHTAMRRTVMGADATQRHATSEEVGAMQRLLRDGLDAGAIGFSSSWALTHNDGDGVAVPSRHGSREELLALAGTLAHHEGTSLEFIPMVGHTFEPWALELMADLSTAAQRPLNWNLIIINAALPEEFALAKLQASDQAAARGGRVVALTMPHDFPVRMSFAAGVALDAIPGWGDAMALPIEDKVRLFRDPDATSKLKAAAAAKDNPMARHADWASRVVYDVFAPENQQYRGQRIADIAAATGRGPWETLVDIALADDLLTTFGSAISDESDEIWQARARVCRDPRTLIGGSDGGAHLDMLGTFNYPTMLLAKAVREHGVLGLEEAVQLLTQAPAELYGVVERGQVATGWHADLVVFDPATVASDDIAMRLDMPGGAGRLYAGSKGIDHVIVNGQPIVSNGVLTDQRSGSILRSGTDTKTPALS